METPENAQEPTEPQVVENPSPPQIPLTRSHRKKILKIVVKKPIEKIVEVDTLEEKEELTYKQKYEELMKSVEPKVKRERTPAQVEAFKKAQQVRTANAVKRREEIQRIADSQRKDLETKLLKKALAVKKRQIRERKALESIPDDDEPVQSVLDKARKINQTAPQQKAVAPPTTPIWTFV